MISDELAWGSSSSSCARTRRRQGAAVRGVKAPECCKRMRHRASRRRQGQAQPHSLEDVSRGIRLGGGAGGAGRHRVSRAGSSATGGQAERRDGWVETVGRPNALAIVVLQRAGAAAGEEEEGGSRAAGQDRGGCCGTASTAMQQQPHMPAGILKPPGLGALTRRAQLACLRPASG